MNAAIYDYQDYLKSEHWRKTRELVLLFWDYRCAACFSDENVEVHHRTYERLGRERLTDCIPLCDPCHELFHMTLRLEKTPPLLVDQLSSIITYLRNGVRM